MFLRSCGQADKTKVDVEWIWHIVSISIFFFLKIFPKYFQTKSSLLPFKHRLHPVEYEKDCIKAFGFVIPSQYPSLF